MRATASPETDLGHGETNVGRSRPGLACCRTRRGEQSLSLSSLLLHMIRIVLAVMVAGLAAPGVALGVAFDEYQVKATFLYNFTRFVTWPTNSFVATDSPIVIGLVGRDPFAGVLEDVIRGENVHGRSLQLRRLEPGSSLRDCHLLFISNSEKARVPEILSNLDGTTVLVVGDVDGFCQSGGTINLVTEDNRVVVELNRAAAKRAGLTIDSRLQRLSRLIEEKRPRK